MTADEYEKLFKKIEKQQESRDARLDLHGFYTYSEYTSQDKVNSLVEAIDSELEKIKILLLKSDDLDVSKDLSKDEIISYLCAKANQVKVLVQLLSDLKAAP